jgi:hypothetical protein
MSRECPKCHDHTGVQDKAWIPPQGVDPKLRRFKCKGRCGHEWYEYKDSSFADHLGVRVRVKGQDRLPDGVTLTQGGLGLAGDWKPPEPPQEAPEPQKRGRRRHKNEDPKNTA